MRQPNDTLISASGNYKMFVYDLYRLLPCKWLNDEVNNLLHIVNLTCIFCTFYDLLWCGINFKVINAYLHLIMSQQDVALHVFPTFFFTKLSVNGIESVKRWTKAVFSFNITIIMAF